MGRMLLMGVHLIGVRLAGMRLIVVRLTGLWLETRTDTSTLKHLHPQLAAEFASLQD
jgi:hypothetical protein